jgi:ubiquinone/menaquinone biosynthesis C-methylase UbiE
MGKFHSMYHGAMEKSHPSNFGKRILEIGSGFAEHVNYVAPDFSEYICTDKFLNLNDPNLINNLSSLDTFIREKIKFTAASGEKLPFSDNAFDRLIISCVLHHVDDVSGVLSEAKRVLKPGGTITIYLPMDPGIFYRFIRHIFSHRKQSRIMNKQMSYVKYVWSLEHRNHFLGIISQINWVFQNELIMYKDWPLPKLPWNLGIFRIIEIQLKSN